MQISRGEIWRVNLDPTIGAEIRKTRPVVAGGWQSWTLAPFRAAYRAWSACYSVPYHAVATQMPAGAVRLPIGFDGII